MCEETGVKNLFQKELLEIRILACRTEKEDVLQAISCTHKVKHEDIDVIDIRKYVRRESDDNSFSSTWYSQTNHYGKSYTIWHFKTRLCEKRVMYVMIGHDSKQFTPKF